MRDITGALRAWAIAGESICIATVVRVEGSAPRPAGASMAINGSGRIAGSVSGGCVESALVDVARGVLLDGPPQLVSYGISDEQALDVGLMCGGTIDVFLRRVSGAALERVLDALGGRSPVAAATVLDGATTVGAMLAVLPDERVGTSGDEQLDAAVVDDARTMLAAAETGVRQYEGDMNGPATVFIETFPRPPRMIIFGAIDFAGAVAQMGSFLGYTVTVCDARSAFATKERFPAADEVVVDWPHRYLARTQVDARTVLCVLTHDPKFDVPLLDAALRTPASYIGVMGSRTTHETRVAALRSRGVSQDQLQRLRAPIGMDLGALTPEETAVAIASEIIVSRTGASARPLAELTGPIHGARMMDDCA